MPSKIHYYLPFILMLYMHCNSITDINDQGYYLLYEDHSHGYVYPQDGFFYSYNVKSFDERINVSKKMNDLKAQGIIVINSWYRHGLTGCSPPGSSSYTNTIYPPVLIVMLEKSNSEIEDYGFELLKDPKPIPCGYVVERFILIR